MKCYGCGNNNFVDKKELAKHILKNNDKAHKENRQWALNYLKNNK